MQLFAKRFILMVSTVPRPDFEGVKTMSKRPKITPAENGPYVLENCDKITRMADGRVFEIDGKAALCRCLAGQSPECYPRRGPANRWDLVDRVALLRFRSHAFVSATPD